MAIVLTIALGLMMILCPMTMSALGHPMGPLPSVMMMLFGAMFLLWGGALAIIVKGYRRTSADIALVRTGAGGVRVCINEGCLAFPNVHTLVPVSLKTFPVRLDLTEEPWAPMTKDRARTAVDVTFNLRVRPDKDHIVRAARTFGEQGVSTESATEMIGDKIVSATRSRFAHVVSPDEALIDPDSFFRQIALDTGETLAQNGLEIESVRIDHIERLGKAAAYR